jgi:hypothetical protein
MRSLRSPSFFRPAKIIFVPCGESKCGSGSVEERNQKKKKLEGPRTSLRRGNCGGPSMNGGKGRLRGTPVPIGRRCAPPPMHRPRRLKALFSAIGLMSQLILRLDVICVSSSAPAACSPAPWRHESDQ